MKLIFSAKKNLTGFSILEVIIAIAIISIGLLGVSSLVIQNYQVQSINRDYLVASMLAQEGLEIVRNTRDSNWFANDIWDIQIYDSNSADRTFAVDYDDIPPFNYTPNTIGEDGTKLNLVSGYYLHDAGGTPSPFYRLLTATEDAGVLTVSSQVQWNERGRIHNYTAETELYNWR